MAGDARWRVLAQRITTGQFLSWDLPLGSATQARVATKAGGAPGREVEVAGSPWVREEFPALRQVRFSISAASGSTAISLRILSQSVSLGSWVGSSNCRA